MKKLYYIADLRLPTEKAHSIQIMKMCEAFASQGINVELIVPNKRNNIREDNIFEYYNVKKQFKIRKINSFDLIGRTTYFGQIFYWFDLLTFIIGLFFSSKLEEGSTIYSRDSLLFLPFLAKGYRLQIELHNVPLRKYIFLKLLNRINNVIVITNYLKDILIRNGVNENKIIVMPDAVDTDAFNLDISLEHAKGRSNLPKDKILIGYVGMLKTMGMEKGIDIALKAIGYLDHNTKLVLVGGHPKDIDFYKQLAKNLRVIDKVIFVGRIPYKNVPLYLKSFDVLIAPFPKNDHYEYYMSPLKIFEYMASGRPAVVSDLLSIREVLSENEALLIKPEDPERLASAINEILANKEFSSNLVANAQRKVKNYTWSKRAKNILNLSN